MEVLSRNVNYSENYIESVYDYSTTFVEKSDGKLLVSVINDEIWKNKIGSVNEKIDIQVNMAIG